MSRNIVTDLRRQAAQQVVRLTSGAQMIQLQDDANPRGGGKVGRVTETGTLIFTGRFGVDRFGEAEFS
jgi:hypothetical protein